MNATIFIGHDAREQDAYDVCAASLRKLSSIPLDIRPISRITLGDEYRRKTFRDELGQLWDVCGKVITPMSTDFSLARFFVPSMMGFSGFAVFVDCDFMFRSDFAELWNLRDERFAVQVVKHCYIVRDIDKMDGKQNPSYERKNWSSLVIWNCAHPRNAVLTSDLVNVALPSFLHGFRWLDESLIGQLPFEWNWLALKPKAVHFTYGVPTMPGYEREPFADEWVSWLEGERPGRFSGQTLSAETQADTQADTE